MRKRELLSQVFTRSAGDLYDFTAHQIDLIFMGFGEQEQVAGFGLRGARNPLPNKFNFHNESLSGSAQITILTLD